MLTPKQLYYQYSLNPCINYEGVGTPYDLVRMVQFFKHVKYPCYNKISQNIDGSGANQLGLPYKFLTTIDAGAFTEIQPSIKSGTSHAVRNGCDLARACMIETSKSYTKWEQRMATEYLEYFCGNSLWDNLMMLGPDLVSETIVNNRATGCDQMDCIENTKKGGKVIGAVGAPHGCGLDDDGSKICTSCGACPEDDSAENNPCCGGDCARRVNECCSGPGTSRFDFSYLVPTEDNLFGGNVLSGWIDKILKHIGILKRKSYGGYANFINNTGANFYACHNDMFLKHFQSLNGYDYINNTVIEIKKQNEEDTQKSFYDAYGHVNDLKNIQRVRTISAVTTNIISSVKDLLYNGYGVLLFTNVGFPDQRDSTGLAYPDKNIYHTYNIIGYDDTKTEYPECVFLIANSWGEWNSGGEPSWGPIPPGSFLITESHLNCITRFNRAPDFIDCQDKYCPPPCLPEDKVRFQGCTEQGSCVPFECSDRQRAFGLIVALSLVEGFPAKNLDYRPFYPIHKYKLLNDNTGPLYFKP
jgi:hypothetical protein